MESQNNQGYNYQPLNQNYAPQGNPAGYQPVPNPYANGQPQTNMYSQPPGGFSQPPGGYQHPPPQGYPMGQPQGYVPPPQPTMYNTQPVGYNSQAIPNATTTKVTYVQQTQITSDANHHSHDHHHHHSHNRQRGQSHRFNRNYDERIVITHLHLPMQIRCYNCGHEGLTRAELVDGTCVTCTCILCCCLGLWLCAPCVYCMDGLKDIQHYCSNCHTLVAVKRAC
ncbi:UNKNOWN [Stylonychia lemnae]|uniref:LITAF domain-containing protein n=1 Tax=Stylonychia lemnae TaxID=5949 RepID=A0A078AQT5_STYLE|nr:UNKNOWN [Stylonychia lemnae]|eukprot:CDW84579.1 UNKNOWN [Stylonychia lemnae]